MQLPLSFAPVIFVAVFLAGRFISGRAARLLSANDEAILEDLTRRERKFLLPASLAITAILVLLPPVGVPTFFVGITLYTWFHQRSIASLGLPSRYRRIALLGTVLRHTAVAVFLLFVIKLSGLL